MIAKLLYKLDAAINGARPQDPAIDAAIWHTQFYIYFHRIPFALFSNILSAGILLLVFRDLWPPAVMVVWTSVFSFLCLIRIHLYLHREQILATGNVDMLLRRSTLYSLALSIVWMLGIADLLLNAKTPVQFTYLSLTAMELTMGSTFTFASLPLLARCYSTTFLLAFVPLFLRQGPELAIIGLLMLITYGTMLHKVVKASFLDFYERQIKEQELTDSMQTVNILLHDYEVLSTDFLWETDTNGYLANAAPRLVELAALDAGNIRSVRFTDLFNDCAEKEILDLSIRQGTPFRNLMLSLRGTSSPVWLNIGGGPVSKLGVAYQSMRGVASNITRTKTAEDRLMHMAFHDELTNIPNRALFKETINNYLHRADENKGGAILYLDLNNFKTVNDTLGHAIGDKLLEVVARRLESCIRPGDMVARLGGDEFAILLARISSQYAAGEVVSRIIAKLDQPFNIENHSVRCGASIGIAMLPADEAGETIDEIMKHADFALYTAKERGHNQFCFFDPAMTSVVQRRMQLEIDLPLALHRNEIRLHYQPLIDIETGKISGYEALMRWKHAILGDISPVEFIPLAENSGLIVQLSEWAIHQAASDLASWPDHIHVAVNLSVVQLENENLLPTITDAIRNANITPQRLEFEVTESIALEGNEKSLQTLEKLQQLGSSVALDDFGTGYSSLNYLLKFPFNKIKLDKSFIDDIDKSEKSRSIVHSVTALAHILGIPTTGEGIERPEQLEAIRELGCTQAQGFLFSKPKPYEEIAH